MENELYKFRGYKESRKVLDKMKRSSYTPTSDDLQKVYRMFNYVIPYDGRGNARAGKDAVGSDTVASLLQNGKSVKSLSMRYTTDRQLFTDVNNRLKMLGYDGVEDINDLSTDFPVILFDTNKTLGNPVTIQRGRDAIREMFNN